MFKLSQKYEIDRRFLKCYYIRYSPSEISTINTPNSQIYINIPREDSVISLLNSYLELNFDVLQAASGYINAIVVDYDSEDVTFTGYVYKLNTPHFNVVKRSAYGKGNNYMQEIVEYYEQNCYIPTSGMCFIKCIKYLPKKKIIQKNF